MITKETRRADLLMAVAPDYRTAVRKLKEQLGI